MRKHDIDSLDTNKGKTMLNRLANILWKINLTAWTIGLALAVTYVVATYGFTSAYGFGVYVPNVGGYFFDTTGAQ
jgi:hypothetical protein